LKKLLFIITTILTVTIFISIYLFLSNDYKTFDNKIRDALFLTRGHIKTTNSVVIVDIDEKSLSKLGQWPWGRDVLSKIIVNLTNANALIIGLDIFFPEIDKKSPTYIAKKYNLKIPKNKLIDYDTLFAYVLSKTPTITGYLFNFNKKINKNILPNIPAIFIQRNMSYDYSLKAKGYIGNIPIIQNNAYSGGFLNMIPDIDGVVRHVPLFVEYDGEIYPSLAFEMYRIAMGYKKIFINYSPAGIDSIQLKKEIIKTDKFGRLFVNYRGDRNSFKYISAVDIYNNKFDKNLIKDKFVLIGTSSNGLFDLRVTPFNTVYPGVEIHANVIDNLLKGDIIYRPSFGEILDIFVLILMAILIAIIFYFARAFISISFVFIFSISFLYISYYLLFTKYYIIEIFLPLLELIFLSIILNTINYFFEEKQTKYLKEAFAKKVSRSVMNELIKNPTKAILEPTQKEITIFFSDIRSFTTLSEKLGFPKKVIKLLNFYMTPMVNNINFHKGTVDKFIGDAIMAYWNAPIDVKNHADEAVSSAIEQIKTLKKLNPQIQQKFGVEINIGIGINSGIATIGEMGSEGRADYTVIGDNVNLASRLEGLNKPYKTNILITEFTKNLLTKEYIIRDIDLVRVKGKTKPVKIFQVIDFGRPDERFHKIMIEYHKAIELYRNSEFIKAKEIFEELYENQKDELYKLYKERCEYFLSNPPKNFDGVWTFTTK
jgi:adenylate cyclase